MYVGTGAACGYATPRFLSGVVSHGTIKLQQSEPLLGYPVQVKGYPAEGNKLGEGHACVEGLKPSADGTVSVVACPLPCASLTVQLPLLPSQGTAPSAIGFCSRMRPRTCLTRCVVCCTVTWLPGFQSRRSTTKASTSDEGRVARLGRGTEPATAAFTDTWVGLCVSHAQCEMIDFANKPEWLQAVSGGKVPVIREPGKDYMPGN